MKKYTLVLLIIGLLAGMESCKKSNDDDDNGTTEPDPVSLIRGKWTVDTGYVDVSIFGTPTGSQDLGIQPGSFLDFFSDTEVATFDGTDLDTSDYTNNNDETIVMNYGGDVNTFQILSLSETDLHLYFDSTTTDPTTGIEAYLQFNILSSK